MCGRTQTGGRGRVGEGRFAWAGGRGQVGAGGYGHVRARVGKGIFILMEIVFNISSFYHHTE